MTICDNCGENARECVCDERDYSPRDVPDYEPHDEEDGEDDISNDSTDDFIDGRWS